MNKQELHTAADTIALSVNILLDDELVVDFAAKYNEIINDYLADYNFENYTARFFFTSLIQNKFSKLRNYKKVFPEVIYN